MVGECKIVTNRMLVCGTFARNLAKAVNGMVFELARMLGVERLDDVVSYSLTIAKRGTALNQFFGSTVDANVIVGNGKFRYNYSKEISDILSCGLNAGGALEELLKDILYGDYQRICYLNFSGAIKEGGIVDAFGGLFVEVVYDI